MAEPISPATEGTLLFGRYRVLRELGRGGMGVVHLAHDEELHLDVALKLIPDLVVQDAEAIDDLKKEVLRGRALTHPGIVRTHDFARDAGSAAIVMEYIEGCTLADLKAQQPDRCFDPADLLPWLEQLCPILDYAHHAAKIAHRDLKPRNLMLTAAGRVKVADFGIASSLNDSQSRVSLHANTSGTPPYMSPQQLQGARPSHLDDLYALGALLYELLTGKPPFFRGNIPLQVLGEPPPTMATRREELGIAGRAPISPVWEEAIAACLAKEPEDRPQSAGEFLHRLKTPRNVQPVAMTPQPLPSQQSANTRRRRAARSPARGKAWNWGVGLAVVGFAVTAGWFGLQGPQPVDKSATLLMRPTVRVRATLNANSASGFLIRDVVKGTVLSIQYVSGTWKSSNGTNHDNPDSEGHPDFNRLAIALPFIGGKRGAVPAYSTSSLSDFPSTIC